MMRMIFRLTKGRAFFQTYEYKNEFNPDALPLSKRKIFVIFFQGTKENVFLHRILKICDLFNASRYVSPLATEFNNVFDQLSQDIVQKVQMQKQSKSALLMFFKERIGRVSILLFIS